MYNTKPDRAGLRGGQREQLLRALHSKGAPRLKNFSDLKQGCGVGVVESEGFST